MEMTIAQARLLSGKMEKPSELPSRNFEPRVYGVGAWTDNLHFAYDLMATLRPRVFVELGTDRGESFFAFCQATAEHATGTRCFAVDTWRGDDQAGAYDETTFAEVSAEHAQHYAKFATLVRSSFAEALPQFPDGSIELLHLDGLHTEAAVRADLAGWLPKLAPGGLLLMHDVRVRVRDFGVWKVWEEMQTRGRSFTFPDGPGLGVWQKPPAKALPEPVEALLAGRGAELLEYYRRCALDLQERIARHWRDRTIGQTAAGRQTIIQLFHTHDGIHREEDSVVTRIGHGEWKEVALALPPRAGLAPLRIDFVSPFTTVEIARLRVGRFAGPLEAIVVAGDAERLPGAEVLRLRVTGIDPQLYLPPVPTVVGERLVVELRLRVEP